MGWILLALGILGPLVAAAIVSRVTYGYFIQPSRPDARLVAPKSIQHARIVYTQRGVVSISAPQLVLESPYPSASYPLTGNDNGYESFLSHYGGATINSLLAADESSRPNIDGLFDTLVQHRILSHKDFDPTVSTSFEGAVIHFTSHDDENLVGVLLTLYGLDIYHGRMVEAILSQSPTGWQIEHARSFIAPYANQDEAPQFSGLLLFFSILGGLPLALLGLITLCVRWVVIVMRRDSAACSACGYDVSGLASNCCPECGVAVASAAPQPP